MVPVIVNCDDATVGDKATVDTPVREVGPASPVGVVVPLEHAETAPTTHAARTKRARFISRHRKAWPWLQGARHADVTRDSALLSEPTSTTIE